MATKEKITIEFDVETIQELQYSIDVLVRKIEWSLENSKVRNPTSLRVRRDVLAQAAQYMKFVLNKFALEKAKPVILKAVK